MKRVSKRKNYFNEGSNVSDDVSDDVSSMSAFSGGVFAIFLAETSDDLTARGWKWASFYEKSTGCKFRRNLSIVADNAGVSASMSD